jgi:hypothetical protein
VFGTDKGIVEKIGGGYTELLQGFFNRDLEYRFGFFDIDLRKNLHAIPQVFLFLINQSCHFQPPLLEIILSFEPNKIDKSNKINKNQMNFVINR